MTNDGMNNTGFTGRETEQWNTSCGITVGALNPSTVAHLKRGVPQVMGLLVNSVTVTVLGG